MSSDSLPPDVMLRGEDAAAIDALVDAGLDPGQVTGRLDQRISHVHRLFDLLATDLPSGLAAAVEGNPRSSLLVDVTLARVLRHREKELAGRIEPKRASELLSAQSASALDDLIAHEWSVNDADGPEASTAQLLNLLRSADSDEFTNEQRTRVVESTLERIQRDVESRERRLKFAAQEDAVMPRYRFRLADLVTIAAMLLIGTAILWPIFVGSRSHARVVACSTNMQRAGLGFGLYAGDHDGELPRADVASSQGPWWNVGQPTQSHSANLYRLARDRYVSLRDLACPGNPRAPAYMWDESAQDWRSIREVSYSFQLFWNERPLLDDGRVRVVLTDRSPIVERAMRGENFDPDADSRNHQGQGQHVLLNDGSVLFLDQPRLPGSKDNLWLPRHLEDRLTPSLTGRERPSGVADAFVGP